MIEDAVLTAMCARNVGSTLWHIERAESCQGHVEVNDVAGTMDYTRDDAACAVLKISWYSKFRVDASA